MHSIKRNDIKGTRVAITLREISDEFKSGPNAHIGEYLKDLALSFKGTSLGELEDLLEIKTTEILSTNTGLNENVEILRCDLAEKLNTTDFEMINLNETNNSSYLIKSDKINQFVLNIIEKREKLVDSNNFLKYLNDSNDYFKVPKFIAFGECFINELSHKNNKFCYWAQEYITGNRLSSKLDVNFATDQIFFEVGKIVAYWRLLNKKVEISLKNYYFIIKIKYSIILNQIVF